MEDYEAIYKALQTQFPECDITLTRLGAGKPNMPVRFTVSREGQDGRAYSTDQWISPIDHLRRSPTLEQELAEKITTFLRVTDTL